MAQNIRPSGRFQEQFGPDLEIRNIDVTGSLVIEGVATPASADLTVTVDKDLYVTASDEVYITSGSSGGSTGDLYISTTSGTQDIFIQAARNVEITTGGGAVVVGDAGDSVGFYGGAGVAKQTGVAVTAGAIHAALVALGLIAA